MDEKARLKYQETINRSFNKVICEIKNYNEIQLYIQYAQNLSDRGFNVDAYLGALYLLKSDKFKFDETKERLTKKCQY